jgi:hypothetical protein
MSASSYGKSTTIMAAAFRAGWQKETVERRRRRVCRAGARPTRRGAAPVQHVISFTGQACDFVRAHVYTRSSKNSRYPEVITVEQSASDTLDSKQDKSLPRPRDTATSPEPIALHCKAPTNRRGDAETARATRQAFGHASRPTGKPRCTSSSASSRAKLTGAELDSCHAPSAAPLGAGALRQSLTSA